MKKVVVIGGGILGASAAYHLARAGAKVTLIDRKDPGQATDAAAGIICPWVSQRRNKAWYALAKGGAAFYPSLIEQLGQDGETETGYQRIGAVSLHSDENKLEKMVERTAKRKEEAPEIGDIQKLGPEETMELFPPLSPEYSSVYVSGAARVNGRSLRQALINGAKKHGAEVVYGSARLELKEGKVIGAIVDETFHEGEYIIAAAGAWAAELFEPLGLHFKVTPQKAQIIHLQLDGQETEKWSVAMPPNNQYILSFEGGRVVMGATHEDDMGYDKRVTAGGLNEILGKCLTAAPGLSEGTFVEARVGFRPYTPGFLPVIGAVPGHGNVLTANGLGASGLTAGPFLGTQLAKMALGDALDINLELYDVSDAFEEIE